MDFAIAYTEEQQQFRQEVKDWIAKNVPEEMKEPVDSRDFTEEQRSAASRMAACRSGLPLRSYDD
jgi:hypothetical protein